MKLRDHPTIIRDGRNWPPFWVGVAGEARAIFGELGRLKRVVPGAGRKNKLFLFVEYDGNGYIGTLRYDDADVCARIYGLFSQYIGHSIKDIGDLDISETDLGSSQAIA